MKTYIENDITILKNVYIQGVIDHEKDIMWKYLLEKFQSFNDEYNIFNKISEDRIVILEQKINLNEENMAKFLYEIEEIAICVPNTRIKIMYQSECLRVIVSIKQEICIL